jgi:hypothetical protein
MNLKTAMGVKIDIFGAFKSFNITVAVNLIVKLALSTFGISRNSSIQGITVQSES